MALKIGVNLPQKLVGGGIGGRWEVDPKRCGRLAQKTGGK